MTAGVGGFGRTGPGVGADGKKFAVLRLAVRPERSLAASEAVSAELALVRVPAPLCAVAPFLPGAGYRTDRQEPSRRVIGTGIRTRAVPPFGAVS